jgi:ketosteroid isomerase-like protein
MFLLVGRSFGASSRQDAVSLLEVVRKDVRIRILRGEDPAWPKTKRYLDRLPGGLRSRIEIRAWIARSDRPFPAHVRIILGDLKCWESSHSLGAVGQKATTLTDKTTERRHLRSEFNRWWGESTTIYPRMSEA